MTGSPNALEFRPPDTTHRPPIEALELTGRYAAAGNLSYYRPVSTSRLTRSCAGTGNRWPSGPVGVAPARGADGS